MTARHRRTGRARRRRLLAMTLAVVSLNVLLPEAAWATCDDGDLTTTTYPPEQGTDDPDTIEGDDKPNEISGGKGNDILCGKGGPDKLKGEDDNDTLYGGIGDDYLELGPSTNPGESQGAVGGPGDDEMYGYSDSIDVLKGGTGDDDLTGGTGADDLYGDSGDDIIRAEDAGGADTVAGGPGWDTCYVEDGVDSWSECETIL